MEPPLEQVCTSMLYFAYGLLTGKNYQWFSGETYDVVEVQFLILGGGRAAGGGGCEQESLEKILNKLNSFHLIRKFTAEYSNEKELMRDLFVKPANTQVLDPRSFHSCHCKRAIPFSQAIRLNRICSGEENLDKRCNDLEGWLMESGYNGKIVRKKIRKLHPSKYLLKREKIEPYEQKLPFFKKLETYYKDSIC